MSLAARCFSRLTNEYINAGEETGDCTERGVQTLLDAYHEPKDSKLLSSR